MTYEETLDYLYSQMPVFHREGATAYKPGLERVSELSEYFGSPHLKIRTVHVGGTNGKGSTAHSLAAIFSSAGYRTGLFTSPHIVDFRERIRIDGKMIPEHEVVSFVERAINVIDKIHPSFFELTTVMAFDYFARKEVDVAIIEVGLGGRLDSTNIITPELSVITNISLDHTSLLGNSERAIAFEKAGIIKDSVPVVVGEADGEVSECFIEVAARRNAPIIFADRSGEILSSADVDDGIRYSTIHYGTFTGELRGDFQKKNMATILNAVSVMRDSGLFSIDNVAVTAGLGKVMKLTGLAGRWMKLSDEPLTVCDTGHNPGGWNYISRELCRFKGLKRIVVGFVNDKDVRSILAMIADIPDTRIYFTAPATPRALAAGELAFIASEMGLEGTMYDSVGDAYEAALADMDDKGGEMVFIGGSNFVVADLMKSISGKR